MTKLLAIVGPTAAGKTRMAVEVALALRERGYGPEIVSCDSMAVYRSFDIVADKPSESQRCGVAHHLFDIVEPTEDFTAVAYRELARRTIDDITGRDGVPLLAGGSGLYFRAVVDTLGFAPSSGDVRARLEGEDPQKLFARLREADPESADRIGPSNVRRIVRAVEVLEITGRPPSELRGAWERREGPYDLTVVGLTWDRAELLRLAAERVHAELAAGLVEEVRGVLARGGFSRTAGQALGVKEVIPFLRGDLSLDEATQRLIRNTKSFIRRQLSWFRADPRVDWVDATEVGWDGARSAIVERFGDALAGP